MASGSGNGYTRESLVAFAASERTRFESTLRDLVEIPTVSSDPERRQDVARGAEFAAGLIRTMGGEARVIPTKGHPMVHGVFERDPAFPTVTVYNHLDVQPAIKEDGWSTEPFRFSIQGDRYFGRGTTDDKGPALSALWGARCALDHGARVNI